jgi:hypothetical protein
MNTQPPETLADQLRKLADKCQEMEFRREADALDIQMLRRQVAALWDVAYEGLPRGDAFYRVVLSKTGQTREQAERHFLPDNGPS